MKQNISRSQINDMAMLLTILNAVGFSKKQMSAIVHESGIENQNELDNILDEAKKIYEQLNNGKFQTNPSSYQDKYSDHDIHLGMIEVGKNARGFSDFKPSDLYPTLEKCISDRDFPLKEIEILCIFKIVTGSFPTSDQMEIMHPDNDQATDEFNFNEAKEYNSMYR